MAPLMNSKRGLVLRALDDDKWKTIDEKVKKWLKKFQPHSTAGAGRKENENGAKWLLRGPKGACLAAIIPGDSAAEAVLTTGVISFINLYNLVLVVRVLLTWFPNPPGFIIGPVSTLADPYLNLFRGIIPPLGGSLDLSPVLAFLSINVFTNAAEALPCELPRQSAGSVGGVGVHNAKHQAGAGAGAVSDDVSTLHTEHPSWRDSRMNPVLLFEGLRQAKQRVLQGKKGIQ